jgi:hypothetical protein
MTFAALVSEGPCAGPAATPSFEVYAAVTGTPGRAFHINARRGSDKNDGLSPSRAWRTFQNLQGLQLEPGDRVLLNRGDLWHEELILRGQGIRANAVLVSSYGKSTLPPPRIACPRVDPHARTETYVRANGETMAIPVGGFKGLTLRKSSHVKIDGLDFQGGKVGVYLQQSGTPQEGFEITNCRFFDIASHPDLYFYDTAIKDLGSRITDGRGDRVFWSAAIFVGGGLGDYAYPRDGALVADITVADCRFVGCDTGFATAFYWAEKPNAPLLRRVALLRSATYGSLQGSFMLNNVTGAYIRDFHLFSGGGFSSTGVCGAFLQICSDIDIIDCAFNGIMRTPHAGTGAACHDGVGLDLEGACTDIRIRRCHFVGNAGAGLMLCNTDSEVDARGWAVHPNADVLVEDCVFDRNCVNPDSRDYPERSGQSNFQILSWQPNASGVLRGNHFVRSPWDAGALSPNLDGFARK